MQETQHLWTKIAFVKCLSLPRFVYSLALADNNAYKSTVVKNKQTPVLDIQRKY